MLHRTSTKHTGTRRSRSQEPPATVLVRRAGVSDQRSIRLLARLDDRRLPRGPFLVAEQDGELVAALWLPTGAVVADPFRRTRDASDMLRLRAEQVAADARLDAALERYSTLNAATA